MQTNRLITADADERKNILAFDLGFVKPGMNKQKVQYFAKKKLTQVYVETKSGSPIQLMET